jgi:hypothetical protein
LNAKAKAPPRKKRYRSKLVPRRENGDRARTQPRQDEMHVAKAVEPARPREKPRVPALTACDRARVTLFTASSLIF